MRGQQGRRPSRRRGRRAASLRPTPGDEHVRCDGGSSRILGCTRRGGEYTFVTAYVREQQPAPPTPACNCGCLDGNAVAPPVGGVAASLADQGQGVMGAPPELARC
jgi:hypothetical protein